jgi:hypothetical protein
MAFGMGLAMSPTTDLLMSAVPRSKAGMGSATNDTARELGGALGVAVLGSVMASTYTSEIGSSLTGLPDTARGAAESSLGGAVVVAGDVGGSAGQALLEAAREAWVSGLTLAMVVGAVIVTVAALIAWFGLPDRADDDLVDDVDDDLDAELDALVAEHAPVTTD